jgi:hypothetical protein
MKATELTKDKLKDILDNAQRALDTAAEYLTEGDVEEAEFKLLCNVAARAAIVRAAITSMEVMK